MTSSSFRLISSSPPSSSSPNKSVYKYEHALNGLLEQLDRIESHGDVEAREKMKEVVKAGERGLEKVKHAVGEAVERRLSLAAPVTEGLVKGYEIDEVITEVIPASVMEQVDTPVAIDYVIPKQSTLNQSEAPVAISVGNMLPAEETVSEFNIPMVSDGDYHSTHWIFAD